MKRMSVPERLALNKYELDEGQPHIFINQEVCHAVCTTKPCLFVCPAKVYTEKDGEILVDWAGCLECGTCRVACPHEALTWHYPRGTFGVHYRYG